jgi:hypothetical protein
VTPTASPADTARVVVARTWSRQARPRRAAGRRTDDIRPTTVQARASRSPVCGKSTPTHRAGDRSSGPKLLAPSRVIRSAEPVTADEWDGR